MHRDSASELETVSPLMYKGIHWNSRSRPCVVSAGNDEHQFFLVGEAGLLGDAPQFQLAAAKLSENSAEQLQNKLVKMAPNVTVISVRNSTQSLRFAR